MSEWPSQTASHFRGRALPEPGIPAGYAALIERFDLALPLPPRLAAVAGRHHPVSTDSWKLLTPRHRPTNTIEAQLVFALKWEGVDLERFRFSCSNPVAAMFDVMCAFIRQEERERRRHQLADVVERARPDRA